ncbi:LysM peptidoglycan-binding domain-containing protein [Paenibacillus thalictri]|uniref:LysM peptidoglycan-binding domain-containing protein n=2 Tax=Paenibacillus thalictri TaxID=2527873 RepID=A0A4Q9E026_9BACL|nr:LysM peptidoglycan-binding domain-containing protein [Paenibacillus thalictri]
MLPMAMLLAAALTVHAGTSYDYDADDRYGVYAYAYSDTLYGPPDVTKWAPQPKPAPAAPPVLNYQVGNGDTMYQIARDFNISLQTLMDYNDITQPRGLQIGQTLRIPQPDENIGLPPGDAPVVSRVLSSTLTAYTAGIESTGKTAAHPDYGITYSGSRAEEGRTIAVDPKIIPIGATVYIEGIGIRKAEDTGSAIRGSRIDLFMNDVGQAREFGVKKNVKVFVLKEA